MFNWIILVFYFLDINNFITIEQILIINLPLLLFSRGIFITLIIFKFRGEYNSLLNRKLKSEAQNIAILRILKEIGILLIGIIYFPIAVFLFFYSLMRALNLIEDIGISSRNKKFEIIGKVLLFVFPIRDIF
jgi:hypothetical protein